MRLNITQPPSSPAVVVPTATLFHNASIPSTDPYFVVVFNFAVKARFFGTELDNTNDTQFWNWSSGLHLIRRSGVGASDIVLDSQTIVAQPAVKVKPMGSGEAILVADMSSDNYITTADGDKFPVFNMPAADTTTYPQLRAASAGTANFTANFGSNLTVPLRDAEFKIFSQNGKVIYVSNGNSAQPLYIDSSNRLCHAGGADITATSASLLNSINGFGQARFRIYINESNPSDEYLEHDFSFIPNDIEISFESTNASVKVLYNPNASTDGVPARYSIANARVEADMVGNANLTLKASNFRPDQNITAL